MEKVRFEIAGDLGVITLANPPLNLFSEELIEDLREAVKGEEGFSEGPDGPGSPEAQM
ncbi:MAG TPA: hypothetical protein VHH35_20010 [Pyrinomonadaceae bacterium]|nr:hypothetical protein [Pyrinomonadaceae bacterium]